MTNEAQQLLLECYRRMQEHKTTAPPPAWQEWNRERYDETTEFGPDYAFGNWFGSGHSEAIRMRFRRAINELANNGYLVTYSRWGERLTKVKLTPNGEAECEEIVRKGTP
jgi:hypothetical protein